MNRALRLLWVSLLALALPLQGLAAATMAACGPAHAHDVAHAVHDPQAQHAHAHAPAVPDAAADDPAADDASPPAPSQKCSVCASCCTASAGLPTHAVVAEPAASADSVVDLERATAAMFLTGGPERPPRSFLA